MKIFKDASGREWPVVIDIGIVKRVRDLCGVDLMNAIADSGKLLLRLDSDPVLLCDVLYAVCRDQAQERKISDVDFGRAMIGDAIDRATDAFLEELASFFPARKRAVLQKAIEKAIHYADLAAERALEALDDPETDRRVEKAIAEAFRQTSPTLTAIPAQQAAGSIPGASSIPAPGSAE